MPSKSYKCIAATLTLLVLMKGVSAQDTVPMKPLTGTIKSGRDSACIYGASVKIKGTKKGTTTNEKGQFHLLAQPGDTLEISAVGFTPLLICGNAATLMNITLPEDRKQMNEVVVVGYGNERKGNITGSIASIDAKELSRSADISFDNAIIGKAAGVNILSSSGVPGSATAITIRGLSTLNPNGNQPLIVIDGIPVYGSGRDLNTRNFNNSTTPAIGFGGTSVADNLPARQEFENNPLSSLNPADIASIEILKDAYATSIYGSRGAAGVILITTKKGSKGKASFNLRSITGTIQPIGKYALLNGPQYNEVFTEYYRQLGTNQQFTSPHNTDWVDEVSRTGISQQADLSMSAGTDKTQFFVSGSYTSQPAYIINSDYKRYTGRVNLSHQASNTVTLGINMSVSYTDNTSMNAPAIYRNALLKAPNLPVKDDNGNYLYSAGTNPFGDIDLNPVADALLNTNALETTDAISNLYVQYKPISWLTLRSEFGTQLSAVNAYTRRVKRPSGFGDDAVETAGNNKKIVLNNTANFLKVFNGRHYLNAVAGQSYEQSVETSTGIGGYGFFNDQIRSIQAAQNRYIKASLRQKWALVSYFTRINYEFDNKYLAGITYRLDGSSRFSSNNRYVGFPSISAGWRLSRENFLEKVEWINDLKIRGSIGFSGNNSSTSYYGSQGQYVLNSNNLSYAGTPILQMSQPDNPNLKWERTRSIDVGVDAMLWDNRLSVTIDYYQRRIRDMIMNSAIPLYQGWTSQPQNIGDMVNKGLELTVNGELIRKKDFGWSVNFNVSTNSNKVLRLNFDGEQIGSADEAFKYLKAGQPAGQFFLYDWRGVDAMTGNPLWYDNKGAISETPPASLFAVVDDVNDFRRSYGTSLPDYYGGIGNTIHYKEWELNAFCSFSAGGKMINGSRAALLTYATENAPNLSTEILERWLIPGHQTDIPKLVNRSITTSPGSASSIRDFTTSRTNSRFLEDASYLRLRTLMLSYNVRPETLGRLTRGALRQCQFFLRGTNLLTVTGYSGLDPEVSAFGSSALQSGYDELTMPQTKSIQFGLNLGF